MQIHIRPFTAADYPSAVDVVNAVYPEYPDTVEEWHHWDDKRDPRCKFARWLAELDGQVVGYANYDQHSWMYHPRKFSIFVAVYPALQGRGIGKALYETVLAAVMELDPLVLRMRTREDMARAVRFIRDREFREEQRDWESRLDVPGFDFGPYADVEDKPRSHGIEIKTLAEIEGDPEFRHRLHDLYQILEDDVPMPEPHTPVAYDVWAARFFNDPNLLPEGHFVAVHNGAYVGLSALWKSQASSDELYTGLTGVRREYRRMGIALALKLRAVAYAREQGVKTIKTWNEQNNRAMLSINEMMGFVKQPAWVGFVNVLREE